MNYADNQAALIQYAGDTGYAISGSDFLTQLPVFIFSAENRILRDLDLLATRVSDPTAVFTANSRALILPTDAGVWQVVETIAVIDENGIRQPPLSYVSKEALDAIFPDEHAVGAPSIPRYWAPYTASSALVGPAPGLDPNGNNYRAVVFGVQFPETLSADNDETFISTNLPDLLLAAEMIDVSAWCKNFGAMSDNPEQARDWNQEYERLKGAAQVFELRRKLQASGWSSRPPNPVANPPRPA